MEGYKYLAGYILAVVIHELTVQFIARWINPRSRTVDQMTWAEGGFGENLFKRRLEQKRKS